MEEEERDWGIVKGFSEPQSAVNTLYSHITGQNQSPALLVSGARDTQSRVVSCSTQGPPVEFEF